MKPGEGYWKLMEPVWDDVVSLDTPDRYLATIKRVGRPVSQLCAANLAQAEICNGGFHQFFWNSSGMLCPEAIEGFIAIGMPECAKLIGQAAFLLGEPFPRDREQRQFKLEKASRKHFDGLENQFFKLIETENGGWEAAANNYAARLQTQ